MILITGATGLVGAHLLHKLISEGEDVRAIYRDAKSLDEVKKVFSFYAKEAISLLDKVDWVKADLTDVPSLEPAFENIDYVYHVGAFVSFNPGDREQLRKVNIEGTANIVNLCVDFNVKKLCHVSSIATLSKTVGKDQIDETCDWNPEEFHSFYAISKFGAEQEVWRGSQEGLPVVIVNPGLIFGEGFSHKNTGDLLQKIKKGMPIYPTGSVGVVSAKDVVKASVQLMNSNLHGERFVLVAENISYKNLIERVTSILGGKPAKIKVGKSMLLFIAFLSSCIRTITFGKIQGMSKAVALSSSEISEYDGKLITEKIDFNYTPF